MCTNRSGTVPGSWLFSFRKWEGQGPVNECRTEQVAASHQRGQKGLVHWSWSSGILLRSTCWKDSKGQTEQVPGGGRNSHTVFDAADLTSELGNWIIWVSHPHWNINSSPEEGGGKRGKNKPAEFALYMVATTHLKKHRNVLSWQER